MPAGAHAADGFWFQVEQINISFNMLAAAYVMPPVGASGGGAFV